MYVYKLPRLAFQTDSLFQCRVVDICFYLYSHHSWGTEVALKHLLAFYDIFFFPVAAKLIPCLHDWDLMGQPDHLFL